MSMTETINVHILYLEDDIVVRDSIERTLKLVSPDIKVASNGAEALMILKNNPNNIDIIISDIRMPKMDGLEFLEHLQKENIHIPTILTTAYNETEYLTKAIELKVDKFIQKPINIKELIQNIAQLGKIILDQKELEKKSIQLENYKKAILLTNFVLDVSVDGTINAISSHLSGYFESHLNKELELHNVQEIFSQALFDEILLHVKSFNVFNKTIDVLIQQERFTVNITAFGSLIEDNHVITLSLILKDLTHILKEKDEIIQRLYKDSVTGLPNRQALNNELTTKEGKLVLLLIEIDEFSRYTQVYGYDISDDILRAIAQTLLTFWPSERQRSVYKLESNVFAITIDKQQELEKEEITTLSNVLIKHMDAYVVTIGDISIDTTTTIGASCTGESDLLVEALIALDIAKKTKKSFQCFQVMSEIKDTFNQNILMQQKIKKAFEQNCIIPYYQPVVDSDKKIMKYETLARIKDPDHPGVIITPYFFLNLVKDSKNYETFTKTIIETAVRDMRLLQHNISINLSFEDIINPSIMVFLEDILQKNQDFIITIELLESEGIKDIQKTIHFCNVMKSYGAKIAIDDFGSGYSNYEYFFDIPIDILKIDGSLTKRIEEYKGYILLESIVSFAKKLGIKVIAEFVENDAIFEKLKTLNIDMFQGYFISEPKSLESILSEH